MCSAARNVGIPGLGAGVRASPGAAGRLSATAHPKRTSAFALWRGGASAPADRSWSPFEPESHGSASGAGYLVETCVHPWPSMHPRETIDCISGCADRAALSHDEPAGSVTGTAFRTHLRGGPGVLRSRPVSPSRSFPQLWKKLWKNAANSAVSRESRVFSAFFTWRNGQSLPITAFPARHDCKGLTTPVPIEAKVRNRCSSGPPGWSAFGCFVRGMRRECSA